MQTVLCIDASREPAIGVVAQVSGNTVEVLERNEVVFDPAASFEQILAGQSSPLLPQDQTDKPADFHSPISSAVVIVPPIEYLSTVLFLPFDNPKQLNRIVESELQDIVPFDTKEFVLHHRVVGKRADGMFQVHVAAIPRAIVNNALAACHARGIDPVVLTTPESILEAAATLHASGSEPILYCYVSERFAHLALWHNGSVVLDRPVDRTAPYSNGAHGGSVSLESLLFRVRLEVAAMERRAQVQIAKVVFIDSAIDTAPVSAALGRPVEIVNSMELLKGADAQSALAMLGTLLADDLRATSVLTNFRVKEFAFRPPLKEFLGALRILLPYALVALGLALGYLAAVFLLTQAEIRSLNTSAAKQITANTAGISLPTGNEVKALAAETTKIEDELKDLGSPESYSPLESLAQVSSVMPSIPEVTVDKIDIRGTKVTIEGCAPDYGTIETIENTLTHSPIFMNAKKQSLSNCSGGRTTGRGFKFELWMQE
jgi:hypothetical protein